MLINSQVGVGSMFHNNTNTLYQYHIFKYWRSFDTNNKHAIVANETKHSTKNTPIQKIFALGPTQDWKPKQRNAMNTSILYLINMNGAVAK